MRDDRKSAVITRLKIARGHLDKVIELVEKNAYCVDVLFQSKAVRSAIVKAEEAVLENHLSTCIVDHIRKGQSKKAVEEVMKIFEKQ